MFYSEVADSFGKEKRLIDLTPVYSPLAWVVNFMLATLGGGKHQVPSLGVVTTIPTAPYFDLNDYTMYTLITSRTHQILHQALGGLEKGGNLFSTTEWLIQH